MKNRVKLIPVLITIIVMSNWRPTPHAAMAAVVPVDPGQELYQSIKAGKQKPRPAVEAVAENSAPKEAVRIEGHKKARSKKLFSAAEFVCRLPIETGTFETVCKEPKEAEALLKKMKEQGFDEIWLKTPAGGEVYDALVKSARELEIRINA